MLSRRTIVRSLPFVIALVVMIALSAFVNTPSGAAVREPDRPALAMGATEPDAGAHAQKEKGNIVTKGPEGPVKSFAEQQYAIRAFPAQTIPSNGYSNATYQYNLISDYSVAGGWTERGPNRTPNSNFFAFPDYPVNRTSVSGRATAFAVVPSGCSAGNCQTQYLGTANGGVWKTLDGGQSWKPVFDHNLQISIGALAIDPVNPNIVYAGTGEGNNSADSQHGIGIYRSTDGGNSWTLLGANDSTDGIPNVFINRSVTRIIVDPRVSKGAGTTQATLYVGTSTGTIGCNFTGDTCTNLAPGRPPLGFFYSTDGGQNWTMANPPGLRAGQRINDLAMDPGNPDVLYLGVALYGIYRTTTDGMPGANRTGNWVRLANQPAPGAFYRVTLDFAASTANQTPQILYAAYNRPYNPDTGRPDCNLITNPRCQTGGPEQIYRILITAPQTPDGAAQANPVPNPNACDGQCWYDMPLRIDPTNPNIVYAGGSANYGYFFGGRCTPFYPLSQNCNTALMKTTDGGQTWRDISLDVNHTAIHPDDHFILVNPVDPSTIWTQNDGGNFRALGANAPNGPGNAGAVQTWVDQNQGIGSLQFVGIGVSPNYSVIGGTQDNGTFVAPMGTMPGPVTGKHILLGDGGQGVADPFNSNLLYSEQYGATMFRFNNPTCDFQPGNFPGGYPACGQTWIAPFAGDFFTLGGGSFYEPQTTAVRNPDGSQASNNIFHATFRLWRSQNYGGVDTNNDGDATNDPAEQTANPSYWVPISGDLSCGPNDTSGSPTCGGTIVSVAVAPNDPNTIVASTDGGRVYITHNALAPVVTDQGTNYCPPTTYDPNVGDYTATCSYQGGVTWTEIDAGLPHRVVTETSFAPHSNSHFWVTLSGFGTNTPTQPGHVFETTNSGATWTNIDGTGAQYTLPDMPFNSIQVNQNTGHLYVSADIGVFVSQNDGRTWLRIDYGLPNAPVYQLRLDPSSRRLFAALHGRGIWETGTF